jgi:hypothetical protein
VNLCGEWGDCGAKNSEVGITLHSRSISCGVAWHVDIRDKGVQGYLIKVVEWVFCSTDLLVEQVTCERRLK